MQGVRLGHSVGIAAGLPDFGVFANYALAFWYGSTLVRSGEINAGEIVIVMFCAMIAFMVSGMACVSACGHFLFFSYFVSTKACLSRSKGFGQCFTHLQTFVAARVAAAEIYEVIDRPSAINGLANSGELSLSGVW